MRRKKKAGKWRVITALMCVMVLVVGCVYVPTMSATASPLDLTGTIGSRFTGIYECNLYDEGSQTWYVKDGWIAWGYTGFADTGTGMGLTWYYVEDGRVDRTRTEFVSGKINGITASWYVKSGIVDVTYTGIVKTESGWVYVLEGAERRDYTGLVSGSVDGAEGTWYVVDGVVATDYTGFVYDDGAWKYIDGGRVSGITGLIESTVDGVDTVWYVASGQVDTGYTGLVAGTVDGTEGTWYVVSGQVDTGFTGLIQDGEAWRYITSGRTSGKTGVVEGTVDGAEGSWYIVDGVVDMDYTGTVESGSDTYTVTSGAATLYIPPVEEAETATTGDTSAAATESTQVIGDGNYITTGLGYPYTEYAFQYEIYIGRLIIPSVGIDVGLYNYSHDGSSQALIDRTDTAVFYPVALPYIADHVNQGFITLKNVTPGMYLYITTSGGTYRYICTEVGTGTASNSLLDCNGSPIDIIVDDPNSRSAGAICLYTCKSWPTITYTIWYPA